MAVDFISELDRKFINDNLLLSEDWDQFEQIPDDLSDLLGVDVDGAAEELLRQLPDELEYPMLDERDIIPDTKLPVCRDLWRELSDGSDSGVECISVKQEPLSPASSHCSENSMDSQVSQTLLNGHVINLPHSSSPFTVTSLPNGYSQCEIKSDLLDTPPHTPPNDLQTIISPVITSQPNSHKLMTSPSNIDSTSSANLDKFITSRGNLHKLPVTTLPSATVIQNGRLLNNKVKVVLPSRTVQMTTNCTLPTTSLTQVLGNTVKIQPRTTAAIRTTNTITPPTPRKPLVLTAEEFAKLTSQGMLKLQQAPPHLDIKPPMTTVIPPSSLYQQDGEMKVLKRQQRMIKNRESACLSRKKKKEYLTNVEQKLRGNLLENQKLKQENSCLRKKIIMLQAENEQLRKKIPGGQFSKSTALVLGIVLLFGLNIGPLSNLLTGSSEKVLSNDVIHHGRSLLSVGGDTDGNLYVSQSGVPDIQMTIDQFQRAAAEAFGGTRHLSRDLMLVKNAEGDHVPVSICPLYFNSTESQRLMKELTGWVQGHKMEWKRKQEEKLKEEEKERSKKRKRGKKLYHAPRKLKAAMKGHFRNVQFQDQTSDKRGPYEVQLFTGADRSYQNFLNSIQRRNDTIYVVSFRRDHLLLPATATNQSIPRPRMSLVMPAVGLNDSMQPPEGSIAMMQIDCDVTATKLLHIHETEVPRYHRENSTQQFRSHGPLPRDEDN